MRCDWCEKELVGAGFGRGAERLCGDCIALALSEVCPMCGGNKQWKAEMCEECLAFEMREHEQWCARHDIAFHWHLNRAGGVCAMEICQRCGGLIANLTTCTACSHRVQELLREAGRCKC